MNLEDVLKIFEECNAKDLHVHPNIPKKKLDTAKDLYPVDSDDTPVALIDATVFGSAKCGLVIGLKGIYWRNDWTAKTVKTYLSWEELSIHVDKMSSSFMELTLAPGCVFNMSGSQMKSAELIGLLKKLCRASKPASTPKKVSKQDGTWHLAMDGVSIGDYKSSDIAPLLASEEYDLAKLMVWKDGMGEWGAASDTPDFIALVPKPNKQAKKSATPPPIPKARGEKQIGDASEALPVVEQNEKTATAPKKNSTTTSSKMRSASSASLLKGNHPDQLFARMKSMNSVDNVFNFFLGDNGQNTVITKDFQSFLIRTLSAFRKEVTEKKGLHQLSNDLSTLEVSGMAVSWLLSVMRKRKVPEKVAGQVVMEGIRASFNISGPVQDSDVGMAVVTLSGMYEATVNEGPKPTLIYLAARLIGGNRSGELPPDNELEELVDFQGKEAQFDMLMDNLMAGLINFHKETAHEANFLVGKTLDLFPVRY